MARIRAIARHHARTHRTQQRHASSHPRPQHAISRGARCRRRFLVSADGHSSAHIEASRHLYGGRGSKRRMGIAACAFCADLVPSRPRCRADSTVQPATTTRSISTQAYSKNKTRTENHYVQAHLRQKNEIRSTNEMLMRAGDGRPTTDHLTTTTWR